MVKMGAYVFFFAVISITRQLNKWINGSLMFDPKKKIRAYVIYPNFCFILTHEWTNWQEKHFSSSRIACLLHCQSQDSKLYIFCIKNIKSLTNKLWKVPPIIHTREVLCSKNLIKSFNWTNLSQIWMWRESASIHKGWNKWDLKENFLEF